MHFSDLAAGNRSIPGRNHGIAFARMNRDASELEE